MYDPIIKSVKCLICKKDLKLITPWHLKKHGVSMSEYKEKFPLAPVSIGMFNDMRDEFKERWLRGQTYKEIQANMGINVSYIYLWSRRLKLPERTSNWVNAHKEKRRRAEERRHGFVNKIEKHGAITIQEAVKIKISPRTMMSLFTRGLIKRFRPGVGKNKGSIRYGGAILFGSRENARRVLYYVKEADLAKRILTYIPDEANVHLRKAMTQHLKEGLPIELIYWMYKQKGYKFSIKGTYKNIRCRECKQQINRRDKIHPDYRKEAKYEKLCLDCRAEQWFLI